MKIMYAKLQTNEKIENIEVSLCGEYSVIDTANGTAKIEGNKLTYRNTDGKYLYFHLDSAK